MNGGAFATTMVVALLAFALGVTAPWLYEQAASYDAEPDGNDLKSQMMRRKSDAMQALLDAAVRGRLTEAVEAADRLDRYSAVVDGFLSTDMYDAQGAAYAEGLRQLRVAASADDLLAARDAIIAIEQACLDCHRLLLAPNAPVGDR